MRSGSMDGVPDDCLEPADNLIILEPIRRVGSLAGVSLPPWGCAKFGMSAREISLMSATLAQPEAGSCGLSKVLSKYLSTVDLQRDFGDSNSVLTVLDHRDLGDICQLRHVVEG